MSFRLISLILVLLGIWLTSVHASDERIDYSKFSQGKDSSHKIDPDIEEARKRLNLAFLKSQEIYHIYAMDHVKKEWDHRLKAFSWNFWTSVLIFIIVVIIMLTGLYFSYMQFKESSYGKNEDSVHSTQIKISRDGLEISSPVIGLLILFISLGFFYLYLKEVYPLQTIQNNPVFEQSHKENDDNQESRNTEAEEGAFPFNDILR